MSQPTPEQQAIIAELRDINRTLHTMVMQYRYNRGNAGGGSDDDSVDKFSKLIKQQSKNNRADQAREKAVTSSRIAYAKHLNELAKSQSQSLSQVTKMISEQRRMSDMMLNSMTNSKKDEARIVREFQKAFASSKAVVDGFSSKIKTLEDVLKAEDLSKTLLKAQSVYENAAKMSTAKNETVDVDGIRDIIEDLRKQQMLSDDEIRKVLPGMLEAYEGMAGHQADYEKQIQDMRSNIEASIQKGILSEEEANKKRAEGEEQLREQLIKTLKGMNTNSTLGGKAGEVAATAHNAAQTNVRATGKSFAKLDGITKNVTNRFMTWSSNLASSDAIIENFKKALKGATDFTSNQFTHGVETTISGALQNLGKSISMGMDPDKMVEIYTKYAGQRRREGSDVFNKYMEQGVKNYLQNAGFNRSDAAKMMMQNMDTFIQAGVAGPKAAAAQGAYAEQLHRLTAITGLTSEELKGMNDSILRDTDFRSQMGSMNEQQRQYTVDSLNKRREENFLMGLHAGALEKQISLQKAMYSINDPKQRMKNIMKTQVLMGAMGYGKDAGDMSKLATNGDAKFIEMKKKQGMTGEQAEAERVRLKKQMVEMKGKINDNLNGMDANGMPTGSAYMQGALNHGLGGTTQQFAESDAFNGQFANALAPSEEQLKSMNTAINERVSPAVEGILSFIQRVKEPFSGGGSGSGVLQGIIGGVTGIAITKVMSSMMSGGGAGGGMLSRLGPILQKTQGLVSGLASKVPSMMTGLSSSAAKIGPLIQGISSSGASVVSNIASKAGPMLSGIASSGSGILNSAKAALGSPAAGALAKKAGVAGAALDVGFGVNDLLDGKRQTELSGWDYLSPMRVGMWAGEKANQGYESISGQSLGSDIYDWTHGDENAKLTAPTTLADINAERAKTGKAPMTQAQMNAKKTGTVTTPAEKNVPPTPVEKRKAAEAATTSAQVDPATAGITALSMDSKVQIEKTQQMVDLLQQVLDTLADNGQNDRSDLAKLNKNARRTSNNTAQGTSMLNSGNF